MTQNQNNPSQAAGKTTHTLYNIEDKRESRRLSFFTSIKNLKKLLTLSLYWGKVVNVVNFTPKRRHKK